MTGDGVVDLAGRRDGGCPVWCSAHEPAEPGEPGLLLHMREVGGDTSVRLLLCQVSGHQVDGSRVAEPVTVLLVAGGREVELPATADALGAVSRLLDVAGKVLGLSGLTRVKSDGGTADDD